MRDKVSWTIEHDIVEWLKLKGNASEQVNEILSVVFQNQKNLYEELTELERKRSSINSSIEEILEKMEKEAEEGNKKEREEAEKKLKEFKEKETKSNEENKKVTEILKGCGILDELLACNNLNEVFTITRKLKEMNVKNPLSKLGIFAALLLKDVSEYNGHFIPLEKPKEETQDEPD